MSHMPLPAAQLCQAAGPVHVFRLHRGDDLLLSIRAYAEARDIRAGIVLSCAGCVTRAVLRDASGVTLRTLELPMEIVSLTGTVSAARTHLHIALAKEDLSVVGGHLVPGTQINTTAEIAILELSELVFSAQQDAETGYDELVIRPQTEDRKTTP